LLWYPTTHTKDGAARTNAVPGHEFSGVIAALGKQVQDFNVGDEVYGMNDWFAEGATAEFCITLPQNIAPKPASLNHETAATVPIGALTAWQGLSERTQVVAHERVLVHGGAGAVGLYAVQLAHSRGAYVIATASALNLDFVKQLGADEVIDYAACRFEEKVKDVDVVFDAIGGATRDRSWKVLKAEGRLVTIAADSEGSEDQRTKTAFFIVQPNQAQLIEIGRHLDAGELKAFAKAVVPLNEASDAYSGTLNRKSGNGKIVISMFP
jgi:NADPH:quinone reductase-like Zn-dependent oxidoreductase